jgi:hypothetical protein
VGSLLSNLACLVNLPEIESRRCCQKAEGTFRRFVPWCYVPASGVQFYCDRGLGIRDNNLDNLGRTATGDESKIQRVFAFRVRPFFLPAGH